MDKKEIEKRFTYHPPRSNQIQRYEYIRDWAKWLALQICDMTPESREQSLAITALEECVMWVNAAIARHEAPGEGIILPDKNTLYPDVLTTSQAQASEPQPPGLPEGVMYWDIVKRKGEDLPLDQASEPTGNYQVRDHVSYAVGDPYGMFSYIPHVLLPNGGVLMSQDAIEEAWRRSHDFEPLEGWRASRYSENEGAQ